MFLFIYLFLKLLHQRHADSSRNLMWFRERSSTLGKNKKTKTKKQKAYPFHCSDSRVGPGKDWAAAISKQDGVGHLPESMR